jgi:hypothetical protein
LASAISARQNWLTVISMAPLMQVNENRALAIDRRSGGHQGA